MVVTRLDADVRDRLHARLRQPPGRFSVPGSLPVPFFGDLFAATVATVGLNPSDQEYLSPHGEELGGPARRFQTLRSLGASDRSALTAEQCERAIETMRTYYEPGKPVYRWFRSLDRVMLAMGYRFEAGEIAHLELVQEATTPAWSCLARNDPAEARRLLAADLPFLRWQLETFPFQTVVCNGRTVFDRVLRLLDGRVVAGGKLARLTWYVATASIGSRDVRICGWNIPLARPTGLGKTGEDELGRLLNRGNVAVDVEQP